MLSSPKQSSGHSPLPPPKALSLEKENLEVPYIKPFIQDQQLDVLDLSLSPVIFLSVSLNESHLKWKK